MIASSMTTSTAVMGVMVLCGTAGGSRCSDCWLARAAPSRAAVDIWRWPTAGLTVSLLHLLTRLCSRLPLLTLLSTTPSSLSRFALSVNRRRWVAAAVRRLRQAALRLSSTAVPRAESSTCQLCAASRLAPALRLVSRDGVDSAVAGTGLLKGLVRHAKGDCSGWSMASCRTELV